MKYETSVNHRHNENGKQYIEVNGVDINVNHNETSIGHMPKGIHWEFDESVATIFTDMVSRSIPQYNAMRSAVFEIGKRFVKPGSSIVDLGSSVGDSLAPFISCFGANNNFAGVEVSAPMLGKLNDRFSEEIKAGILKIYPDDLSEMHPPEQACLTLSILTLQFVPINHRQKILDNIYRHTQPGGAFIYVEKILGSTSSLNDLQVDIYHDFKMDMGYSALEVEKKRASLENVLVPLTSSWNEELLKNAGFTEIDCFWRWMNFAGYVAIKN